MTEDKQKVSFDEGVEVIRRMMDAPGRIHSVRWRLNVIRCVFDGWLIDFFDDCDELDYVESIISPDGRESGFRDFVELNEERGDSRWCPLDAFTQADKERLLEILTAMAPTGDQP